MSDEEVEKSPNFLRAMFALEHQFHDVDNLIRFWKWFGPGRCGPEPERKDPWWQNMPSTFIV